MTERFLPACGPFVLEASLNSGQVFHFTEVQGAWAGALGEELLVLRPAEEGVALVQGDPERAAHYLALDHDLEAIYAEWPHDSLARESLAFSRGIRILRQPLWECVATFITSAQKQVAHIREISLALRERYGPEAGSWGGMRFHAYPRPEQLAGVAESEIRALKLGYRAPLMLGAAQAFAEGRIEPEVILHGEKKAALAECVKIPGVGVKVANCILLFAAGRLDAVPIDVWIRRVLESYKPRGKQRTTGAEAFLRRKLGPNAGYVQQYLFHYVRKKFGRRQAWEAFSGTHEAQGRPASRRNRRAPRAAD